MVLSSVGLIFVPAGSKKRNYRQESAPPPYSSRPMSDFACVDRRARTRMGELDTPAAEIRFFGNNFRSALLTCRRLRISLCLIHTKPPPARFGVGIAWSDANPHPGPLPLGR